MCFDVEVILDFQDFCCFDALVFLAVGAFVLLEIGSRTKMRKSAK